MKLTVIFRNDAPVLHLNEPCSHRRVTIELTTEQVQKLKRRVTGTSGYGESLVKHREEISMCFIEDD